MLWRGPHELRSPANRLHQPGQRATEEDPLAQAKSSDDCGSPLRTHLQPCERTGAELSSQVALRFLARRYCEIIHAYYCFKSMNFEVIRYAMMGH